MFNDKGKLTPGKMAGTERTVYIWNGYQPLSMHVLTAERARACARRFGVEADTDLSYTTSVVVGVRTNFNILPNDKEELSVIRRS